jgi:hypothetical protein
MEVLLVWNEPRAGFDPATYCSPELFTRQLSSIKVAIALARLSYRGKNDNLPNLFVLIVSRREN